MRIYKNTPNVTFRTIRHANEPLMSRIVILLLTRQFYDNILNSECSLKRKMLLAGRGVLQLSWCPYHQNTMQNRYVKREQNEENDRRLHHGAGSGIGVHRARAVQRDTLRDH